MIPSYEDLMLPLLKFLADGKVHSVAEAEEHLANVFGLTDEEQMEKVPSGSTTLFKNRVAWARTYLVKAGLIRSPNRGYVVITPRGWEVYWMNLPRIDWRFLMRYPEFMEFKSGSKQRKTRLEVNPKLPDKLVVQDSSGSLVDLAKGTADEVILKKLDQLNQEIRKELLREIVNTSMYCFKRAVVDLLTRMGYGGSFEEVDHCLCNTKDGLVEGLIKHDVLGLDNLYVQVRRRNEDTIGKPEIQSFCNFLRGKGVTKGVLMATASFTLEAQEYVSTLRDIRIVLIDREKLLDYMLRYDVGVRVDRTLEKKRIDKAYFLEN